MNAEQQRLENGSTEQSNWKKWGPYLSERQWGTVREDCGMDGNSWNHFTHDQARSRAYRWGEDGLGGISDDQQQLCFAVALWNGQDQILKERLFGLTNSEGNHGEDVKEYYFYIDSTPTHSYMKCLYKYPQKMFPYEDLLAANQARSRSEREYELLDTGIFAENRYFDVFVEYAKASPEDILVEVTVHNRGPEAARLEVLPTLWFRNDWTGASDAVRPVLKQADQSNTVELSHPILGQRFFYAQDAGDFLFTENESNLQRLYSTPNPTPYVKDGIHELIVMGNTGAVNPEKTGTKVAARYSLELAAGESRTLRLRLKDSLVKAPFSSTFKTTFASRRKEADEFYAQIIPASCNEDQVRVLRQALAGMLWSKQYYYYDVGRWLNEHGVNPMDANAPVCRNRAWGHMRNADVISMPDKWEYPWYAAWDLAFHVTALSLVDVDFSKAQLELFLSPRYLHPSGQIPAYEWNFGDVNPPVHAWSTLFMYLVDKTQSGHGDLAWLERCFHKLMLNFNWWVNRKDRNGNNAFEGGFLGLDNIGVFDRSSPLPTGGYLEQADGTAWMALYCQNMFEMSIELARNNPIYVDMAIKFCQHFMLIASGMIRPHNDSGMWDEQDGFFYDVLCLPDGSAQRLKVRSMVGLLPLCAVTTLEADIRDKFPQLGETLREILSARPELVAFIHDSLKPGYKGRILGSILNETNLRRVLSIMLDENEFLSSFGLRSLSRYHEANPYVYHIGDQEYRVDYVPGESDNAMFGGNSNWRGPVWVPVNMLIIRALLHYYHYYGKDFTVECPTGSGNQMHLYAVAQEITRRLSNLFLKDQQGYRPASGPAAVFHEDPHWNDYPLFYEYFHGDTGEGLGASHQTGWTGAIARLIHLFASTQADEYLEQNVHCLID